LRSGTFRSVFPNDLSNRLIDAVDYTNQSARPVAALGSVSLLLIGRGPRRKTSGARGTKERPAAAARRRSSQVLTAAIAVYERIDYVKVTPESAMATLGYAAHPEAFSSSRPLVTGAVRTENCVRPTIWN
jgi:hypothetical protein